MKILVTGANGFIGKHCLKKLENLDCEIHAISTKDIESYNNIFWHKLDLFDFQATGDLLKSTKPTHLLHLAWNTEHGKFWSSPENLEWLKSSINLLEVFKEASGKRIVTTGTCAQFTWNDDLISEMKTLRNAATAYGQSKNALQEFTFSYSKINKLSSAWAYIYFLYGPGENKNRLVPLVIKKLLNSESVETTAGTQIRDFIYVEDAADALIKLLLSDLEGSINIASGEENTLKDILKEIENQINSDNLIKYGSLQISENEPKIILADTKKLKKELDFIPSYNLKTGLAKSINWWKKQI